MGVDHHPSAIDLCHASLVVFFQSTKLLSLIENHPGQPRLHIVFEGLIVAGQIGQIVTLETVTDCSHAAPVGSAGNFETFVRIII